MFTYKTLSTKIINGDFKEAFYYQPFYYAIFLPFIRLLFGKGIWVLITVQSILSALTVWFAGLSAMEIRSRASGIITSLLLTFSVIMILFTPYYLIATLQAFWLTLLLYICIKLIKKQRINKLKASRQLYLYTCVLGIVTGFSILTRGNIWVFVPGIIIMLLFPLVKDCKYKPILLHCSLFLLFLILPQLPFIWHNTKLKGEITGPSTAAGSVLALGNTPESPPGGRDAGTGAGPMEYPEICRFWKSQSKSTPIYIRVLKWFADEPLAFCELQFRKMILFWDYREIPNNLAIETQGIKSDTLRTIGFLPIQTLHRANGNYHFLRYNLVPMSLIILTLGLAGVMAAIFRLSGKGIKNITTKIYKYLPEYILIYFITAYWLGTAFFYILARFRVPIIPLLAVSGSIFLCRAYRIIQLAHRKKADSYNRKYIAGTFIILIAACFTVTFGYTLYQYGFEAKIIAFVRPDGIRAGIGKNTIMIKDNGPLSFGSWTPFELIQGVTIEKNFIIPSQENKKKQRIFKLESYWQTPGTAILNLNGKDYKLTEKTTGRKKHIFTLPESTNNTIAITPVKINSKVLLFIDGQRCYGRTKIAESNPEGELVSTLYIKDERGN
jgi:4-amino-4-deoxy-L-arabinose transferase-like glycosyltransferase